MIINELMDGIRRLDMVLPEFQREYVWEREQAKQLLVSLFRNYPTGSLLFWKTDKPPDIKHATIPPDKIGSTMVILDGQQRLTTLYLFTRDEIPPYYTPDDIKNDPRSLYFDLETGEFQYYQAMRMQHNPTWVPVTDCFAKSIKVFEVAKEKAGEEHDPFDLAQLYTDNLTRLCNIRERDYPIQTVPSSAEIDDAIDVFDRVNSLGTKLSEADLALAHVTGRWPQARQVMKRKLRELEDKQFRFDLTFMIRCLTAVVKGRALFETIHKTEAEALKEGWKKLTKILDYLVTVLPAHAHVHSTDDLNTTNVLVPAFAYLVKHEMKFKDDRTMRRFIHWMYAASAWARYTSQTSQRLDHDISIVQRSETPWKDLVDAIIDQRGRIEVKPADLEGRTTLHPLYRMTFIMAKAKGATDWFNGAPLGVTQGPSYAIHSHHIFPVSLLYSERGGYTPENHLHKKIVNEIANRAFLTEETNLNLSNSEPAEYLGQIESKYPGALAKQFVPQDPTLWSLDRFEDFLAARRVLIAEAINESMEQLLRELEPPQAETLADLLRAGESAVLEFKSSLRWDTRTRQVNTELQKTIAKSVAGFLNFEEGRLLIGVGDDGTPVGIEDDLTTLKRKDRDGFEQALVQVVENYLGAEFAQYVHIGFEETGGKTVCIVRVEPSPKPVWLADRGSTEFYIRAGNTTRPLDVQATHEYISMHWET